jgi:hypothetical protein
MSAEPGYLYCMTNPLFDGMVKVGFTNMNPVEKAEELSNGPVPIPFEVAFAKRVLNANEKEKVLHKLLEKYTSRVHPAKDFFRVSKESVAEFFELLEGEVWSADSVISADIWKALTDRVFEILKKEYPKWSLVNLGQAKMRVASAIKNKYGVNTVPTVEQVREAMALDSVAQV